MSNGEIVDIPDKGLLEKDEFLRRFMDVVTEEDAKDRVRWIWKICCCDPQRELPEEDHSHIYKES